METRPRPTIVSIPEPTNDVDGLFRSVVALKQSVEQMLGTRGRAHGGLAEKAKTTEERKATIHISPWEPHADIDGDFWLAKGGEFSSLSISINGKWYKVWPP